MKKQPDFFGVFAPFYGDRFRRGGFDGMDKNTTPRPLLSGVIINFIDGIGAVINGT